MMPGGDNRAGQPLLDAAPYTQQICEPPWSGSP
jgi:hypothetical protein